MSEELHGCRVGVFGKGGSGKSTVVVLLARALTARGYHVAVLDADSTNFGLHRAFGIESAPTALLEHFGGMVFSGGSVTCPVDDPRPLANRDVDVTTLDSRYCRPTEEGILLLSGGKLEALGAGAGCDGPIAKIARDLRLEGLAQPAVTLCDFKAGLEDSARGVLTGLDWALVVVDPTIAGIHVATSLAETVREIRAGKGPATEHLARPDLAAVARQAYADAAIRGVAAVLNRSAGDNQEQHVRAALRAASVDVLGTIHADAALEAQWLAGERLDAPRAFAEAGAIAVALERLVTQAPQHDAGRTEA